MKKIIIAVCAVITMMICIASPLFIKPIQANAATVQSEVGVPTETSGNRYITLENILSYYGNDKMYYFVTGQDSYFYTDCLIFDDYDSIDENYVSGNYTYKYRIVRPTLNGGNAIIYSRRVDTSNQYDWKVRCTETEQTGNVLIGNNYISLSGTGITHTFGNNGSGLVSHEENFEKPSRLVVNVDFSPDLVGDVDRRITSIDGTSSMRKDLVMGVINQSRFPIQYSMRIMKLNQSSHRSYGLDPESFSTQFDADSVQYDDDPVFVYYKNEWVYCTNLDSDSTFWDLEQVKENKGSAWHYVAASSQDIVTFNFSQLNLDENVDYYVEVRAIRNDYGIASENFVQLASDDPAVTEYYQLQSENIEQVFYSEFRMINYKDVVYDPNDDSNGVLPYNGKNGIVSRNTYQYGRNARENSDGSVDYTSRNLYTDQNSWYNQQYQRVVDNHNSSYSSTGSVPSSLTSPFDSFMKFINYVFLRFPSGIQQIFVFGFISIVVLGIVLKVIK